MPRQMAVIAFLFPAIAQAAPFTAGGGALRSIEAGNLHRPQSSN